MSNISINDFTLAVITTDRNMSFAGGCPVFYASDDDDMQISFASNEGNEIVEELKTIDINTLTPIEALQKLYELKNRADKL